MVQVTYERCCGLDVHKKTVVASVITPGGQETRTFGTTTGRLQDLAAWLTERGVSHVAMESTGVYWESIYNVLETYPFELLVVNAQHVKAVPGRKTDVKDAEWIADLLRHGLLRPSFIPTREQRELRELTRHRQALVQDRSKVIQRIQKVLEGANIKLSSVASNVVGLSGRAILDALVGGETDPSVLADLAQGRLHTERPALEEALLGVVGAHQRLLLQSELRQLDFLNAEIERLDLEVQRRTAPFEEELARLDTIPGVGRRIAEILAAEVGVDMAERFPTSMRLASWARVCPGNNESAGKRKSGSTGRGNRWLRPALVEAARAAGRGRGTYLSAQYQRLAVRRGAKRAALAVAHSILVIAYRLLKDGTTYRDLGPNYFDERHARDVVLRAVQRITNLGYTVTLQPRAA
jgi:transposase